MKTEGQIKQKVKQVVYRHRKEFIRRRMATRPENCGHNRRISLPQHHSNRGSLGICGYCPEGEGPRNVVCDSSMEGERQAVQCPYYEGAASAQALKQEFNERLGLEGAHPVEIGYIAKEYPDVAALLWVLGPSNKQVNTAEPTPEPQENILAFFGDEEEPEDVPERPLVEDMEAPA